MTTSVDVRAGAVATVGAVGEPRSAIGRRLAALSLVIGAGGNTTQAVLSQVLGGRPESVADQIALANQHPVLVTAMCVVGTVAAVLLVPGMWGFLAMQVSQLIGLTALLDPAGADAAIFLDDLESSRLLGVMFAVPFMVGCVLGMLTLTIGLLARGGVPRWIPEAWLVFIVLDFSIGAVGLRDVDNRASAIVKAREAGLGT